jgi:hypothetical protein
VFLCCVSALCFCVVFLCCVSVLCFCVVFLCCVSVLCFCVVLFKFYGGRACLSFIGEVRKGNVFLCTVGSCSARSTPAPRDIIFFMGDVRV